MIKCIGLLLAVSIFMLLSSSAVQGQDSNYLDNCQPHSLDPTQTTGLSLVLLPCPFAGNPDDIVYVFDSQHDLNIGATWQQSVNFDHSTWVFDAKGDQSANLIIRFSHQNGILSADLFDDQNKDGRVAYTLNADNSDIKITESNIPSIHVQTPEDSWVTNGKVDYNLDMTVEGPITATFDARTFLGQPKLLAQISTIDNKPEFQISVRDLNNNGHPDYDLRQSFLPLPATSQFIRTSLQVDAADDEPVSQALSAFWPYLSSQVWGFGKIPGHTAPPIQVDWSTSKIINIAEIVGSRQKETNWFIYSIQRFGPGYGEYANFEDPFMFYDLADDHDGNPELMIRDQYTDLDAPDITNLFATVATNDIRYSWDQDNNGTWDYKIGVLGRKKYTTTVNFPEFSVKIPAYQDMPTWVTKQPWDIVSFVAVEGAPYYTTEGIYEWGPGAGLTNLLQGFGSGNVENPYVETSNGFRGDYSLAYFRVPRLYFSDVDHKLHLMYAQQGNWPIDDHTSLAYQNLNNGPTIDRWIHQVDGLPTESLTQAGNYLIYHGDQTIIKYVPTLTPSLFESPVPGTHQEWLDLKNKLDTGPKPVGNPADLRAMMEQFAGPELQLQNGTLRDFRFTESGFRFVLDLQPDFSFSGDNVLGTPTLSPGSYLVVYDGHFDVQPLTAPDIQLVLPLKLVGDSLLQYETNILHAEIRNDGLEDANQVQIDIQVSNDGTNWTPLRSEKGYQGIYSVNSGQTVDFNIFWTPDSPGKWQMRLVTQTLAADQTVLSSSNYSQAFDVQAASLPATNLLVSGFNLVPAWAVLTLWVSLISIFCVIFALIYRRNRQGEEPQSNADES